MPEVSIVICTRNRATQLERALEAVASIRSAHEWEAVVVDNGSSDRTAEVIASFTARDPRFRHIFEGQQGLGAARDTACQHARGDIVSFTDDDCYVAQDFVDCIVEAFADRPEAGYLGGRILLHDPTDAPITIMEREDPFDVAPYSFVAAGMMQGANLSFRREALDAIGGFSRDMGAGTPFPCEDVDAVGSASWMGFAGRYDPRPTVSHHHGRKLADIPRLRAGYDAGRAAYYAKFIANKQSRKLYLVNFFRRRLGDNVTDLLVSSLRVAGWGTRYLWYCRRPEIIPLFVLTVALQTGRSTYYFVRGGLRRMFA